MRILQKRDKSTFQIIERIIPCLDELWHYHSQYELILITKSSGVRFVGNNVSKFLPGDLVLVGPNLPHLWRNDPSYYQEATDQTEVESTDEDLPKNKVNKIKTIIVKFERDFLGKDFFSVPEFQDIEEMLTKARCGLCFCHQDNPKLAKKIIELTQKEGVDSILSFLEVLKELSLLENVKILSSSDMSGMYSDKKNRQDVIINYISDHYSSEISLEDISEIACMAPNSFCRYFKNLTNKPFSIFLNEVRIQNAVRLISLNNDNIKNISYDVGFKSITNFNRQFKKVMNMTPMQYKQLMKEKQSSVESRMLV